MPMHRLETTGQQMGGSLMPVGDVCCNSSPKHPKTGRTGATPTHQRPTWNSSRPRLFRKIRGYQSWSSRTHDPKVAGSNPAPATTEIALHTSMTGITAKVLSTTLLC